MDGLIMETKVCNRCKVEQPIRDFYKEKHGKFGHKSICKKCINSQCRLYRETYPQKIIESKQKSYQKHKKSNLEKGKIYRNDNKESILQRQKSYREKNREKLKQQYRLHYEKNKIKIKQKCKFYREKYSKQLYQNFRNRLNNDKFFKFKYQIRNLIRTSIKHKGYSKKSKTFQLLGCSMDQLYEYLGQQPEGRIHIDHICPLSQAQNEQECMLLQHYTNLRYLNASDNLSKSNRKTSEGAELCRKLLNREWID